MPSKKFNNLFTLLCSILILSVLLFQGCSLNRFVMNSAAGFFDDGIKVVYQEEDLQLAEQFLGSNLKMIEVMIAQDPTNPQLNLLAAQGFGAYSMAFIESKDAARAVRFYNRGLNYALQALPSEKAFTKEILPADLETCLTDYTKEEVPALFWVGYNWGNYILHNLDDPRSLVDLAKVELIMRRCLELDEAYNFAGVDLFYGNFYASRPPMLGGDPEKGKEFYERNLELTQHKFYLTKYFYARYYAVQVQDEELFERLINDILDLDLDKYPEIRLMNAIAKKKANKLKANKEKYFYY